MKLIKELQMITEQNELKYFGVMAAIPGHKEPHIGFAVQAPNIHQAKRKAKERLSNNYTIVDISPAEEMDNLIAKLKQDAIDYVKSHDLMIATPSIAKGFLRKIDKVTNFDDYNKVQKLIKQQLKPKISKA